jgi:sugar (pentulose or hexulose) kinase
LGYYLGLMTAECLRNIGAGGPTLIEGPFAANPWFCAMLDAATGRPVTASSARTGTAIGAAMLFSEHNMAFLAPSAHSTATPELAQYAAAWRQAALAR